MLESQVAQNKALTATPEDILTRCPNFLPLGQTPDIPWRWERKKQTL
jgi:hypothetical protein